MKKMISLLLVLVLAMSLLTACGGSSKSDLKAIKDAGKIVVGITDYAPMDYKDENGEWTGFDAEFAQLFAKELGVDCEFFVISDWGKKFLELETKQIDAVWNGMTITEEAKLNSSVSDPYVINAQVLVMKADVVANYADAASLAVLAVAVAVLMALAFAGYVRLQRRQREATDKLVYTQQQQIYENSRALNDMELKVVISENQALHNAVEMKKQEVINVALSIVEQREYLESLNEIVTQLAKTDDPKEKERLIAELKSSLNQRLSYDRDVDSQYFYAQAESLHEDFNAKLSENFPDLTPQERRLATLLRLGFSSKYIATLMNITPKSVEISRYRLRQKLGLEKGSNLVNFIKSI